MCLGPLRSIFRLTTGARVDRRNRSNLTTLDLKTVVPVFTPVLDPLKNIRTLKDVMFTTSASGSVHGVKFKANPPEELLLERLHCCGVTQFCRTRMDSSAALDALHLNLNKKWTRFLHWKTCRAAEVPTWRLLCSSFVVMTVSSLGITNTSPKGTT